MATVARVSILPFRLWLGQHHTVDRMKTTDTILDRILIDVRKEVAAAQTQRPLADLRRMTGDAPPVRSFKRALLAEFGLIAEIKERSPSQGAMRATNVAAAPAAYEQSRIVRGISVLTNASHFGMSMERDRKSTRLNSSHIQKSRMPSSA